MSGHETDPWPLLDSIQMNLRTLTAQVITLRSQIAAMNLPVPTRSDCPECGVSLAGSRKLAEHLYLQHGGEEPEHWVEAEELAE